MMTTIDKHILDIVNNKDSIEAFYDNYLEHDEDWNDYLDEIENDRPLFDGYRYDYNMYKDEIINEIFGDSMKEQFFNNIIRALVEDITDADKHIMFKYLIGNLRQTFCCRTTINNLHDDYLEDNWQNIMMSYVSEKVNSMILNEEDWLNSNIERAIEDYAFNKIQERISRKIAIEKITRNKLFVLGLSKKLSMRNCGIPVGA